MTKTYYVHGVSLEGASLPWIEKKMSLDDWWLARQEDQTEPPKRVFDIMFGPDPGTYLLFIKDLEAESFDQFDDIDYGLVCDFVASLATDVFDRYDIVLTLFQNLGWYAITDTKERYRLCEYVPS